MIDKSYYNNISSRNILNDYTPKNFSNSENIPISNESLENMVINSNLENGSIIK